MSDYSPTHLFTLVPEGFSDSKTRENIFCTLFPEEKGAEVFSVPIPQYSAELIYAWEGRNGAISPEAGVLPTVAKHLKDLSCLKEHNKLILDFDIDRHQTCILLAEGDRLVSANSYRTVDFPTAVYYMLELFSKSQINPQQTTVNLIGKADDGQLQMLRSYVKDIKLCL
ncbi:MAG: DUF3822 family protein [Bacteroidales bacterium]|nr:DUF3822 family protein [Bacteroidales bacterium]